MTTEASERWADAERVIVRDTTPEGYKTRLYSVVLDCGWCERIIAGGMYEEDAEMVATALSATFGIAREMGASGG